MEKRTVLRLLRDSVAAHPDEPFMKERHRDGWVTASFREIAAEATGTAGFLLSRGFHKGDAVVLLSEGRSSWIAAELGILLAGGVSVPISVKIKERSEILFRVKHSQARFAVVSARHAGKVADIVEELPDLRELLFLDPVPDGMEGLCRGVKLWPWTEVIRSGGAWADAHAEELRQVEEAIREDDPATLTYTSGTTAEPKGILLSHRNYFVNASEADVAFPLKPPSHMLLILPWDHAFAHTAGLFLFLKKASVIAAVEPASTELGTIRNIPRNMKEIGPTYLLVVPALVENFRKNIAGQIKQKGGLAAAMFAATIALGTRLNGDVLHPRRDPLALLQWPLYLLLRSIIASRIRQSLGGRLIFMVSGGSACSIEHVRWFTALGLPLYQGYGLSETSPIISSNSNVRGNFKIGSCGRPFPWAQVRIEGEDGSALPTGETGEICVRGDCVMLGYWRNPKATAEAIVNNWFHTGDLGYLDDDGFLYVVGRIKSLLVGQNGEKYSPEALEQHLMDTVPLISQVMLYNQQNPFTVALVVPDQSAVRELVSGHAREGAPDDERLPDDARVPDGALDAVIERLRVSLMRYRKDPELTARFVADWTPKTFALLPEAFSEENGSMNSSLKLVRRRIMERYDERIRRLYDEEEDPLNSANRDALRSWLSRETT